MRTALLLASAAALSACTAMGAPAPSPAPPQSGASERYRAHGTEPFWDITIAGGRIVYNTPEPGERIEVAAPSPRTTFNGHRYLTARFTVDITHGRCNDGMADRYYADTVRVIFPGTDRALEGCGGATLPPDTLADSGWHIRTINGEAIADSDTYALEFAGGRLSGRAGCNRFSGTYSQTGTTLTTGPIMATRMACPGRMAHERTVMNLLRGPVSISFPDGDTMLLAGNGVTVRLVRQ